MSGKVRVYSPDLMHIDVYRDDELIDWATDLGLTVEATEASKPIPSKSPYEFEGTKPSLERDGEEGMAQRIMRIRLEMLAANLKRREQLR